MQPNSYNPAENFTSDAAALVSGRSTVRPDAVDSELAAIADSINQLVVNIGLIQRDDGHLRDQSVDVYNLTTAVLAMMGSAGFTVNDPVGWLTATNYAARSIVTHGDGTYLAVSSHTSGVFDTDLAAGKWVLLFSPTLVFTPTDTISATTLETAINEVDNELRAQNFYLNTRYGAF